MLCLLSPKYHNTYLPPPPPHCLDRRGKRKEGRESALKIMVVPGENLLGSPGEISMAHSTAPRVDTPLYRGAILCHSETGSYLGPVGLGLELWISVIAFSSR